MKYAKLIAQLGLQVIGLMLIVAQINLKAISTLDNIWNARILGMLALSLIAGSFALGFTDTLSQIKHFVLAFGILMASWLMMGGFFVTNDMLNNTTYTGNSGYWVAFDSMNEIGETVLMIAQAVVIIVPIASLCMTLIFVYDADLMLNFLALQKSAEEKQSINLFLLQKQNTIIDGCLALGFLIAYGWLGSYFSWFI